MKKKLYTVYWDIIKSSEMVAKLPPKAKLTPAMYSRIYTGSGTRFFGDPKPRKWGITIITKAKALDGAIHTHLMGYKPNAPMFLSDLITAVEGKWLAEVDKDLADMDAIEALVTANILV